MPPTNEGMVPVWVNEDEVEEMQVTGALDDANIKYVVESFTGSALEELAGNQSGHSRVLVFQHNVAKAKEIIENAEPTGH